LIDLDILSFMLGFAVVCLKQIPPCAIPNVDKYIIKGSALYCKDICDKNNKAHYSVFSSSVLIY